MKKYLLFLLFSINIFSQNKSEELINFTHNLKLLNTFKVKEKYLDSVIKNNKNIEIQYFANYNLGRLYYREKTNLIKAKRCFLNIQESLFRLDDFKKSYDVNLNLGHINLNLNIGDSALYYYNKSLIISQKAKDSLLISRVYSNIARLYGRENKKKLAIKYFYKSITTGEKINRNLCTTYNNLGNIFLDINNDSAIYYFNKSLNVAKEYKKVKRELRAYTNLGIAYLNDSLKYEKSLYNLNKANEIATVLKEERLLYYINYNLGKYYDIKNKYNNALKFYNKALNSPYSKIDYEQQIELLKRLSLFYEKQLNFKKATKLLKQHHFLKDSIYSVEKNKSFNDIKTKYEVEKKDNKISSLSKEQELAKNKRKSIIIIATSLILILLLLTYFLKNKIKTQKIVQKNKLELFEQEIETKKALSLIEGQENERNRLAKELHDGLGGQLSGIKSIIQTININNLQEKTNLVDKHLSNSIKNLRNISHDLSAVFLKNKEYNILLQQLILETFNNKNIETEISIFPSQKFNNLSERYKLNIFRILQESFQNILKHAKTTYVSVSLILDNEITILIEDNGIGFNIKSQSNGIGLQNIKDRIQSLNGTLYIDSQSKKGTTLNLNIPYNDYRNSNT